MSPPMESLRWNSQAGLNGCAWPEAQLSAGTVTIERPPRQLAVAHAQTPEQAAVAQVSTDGALPPARAPGPYAQHAQHHRRCW